MRQDCLLLIAGDLCVTHDTKTLFEIGDARGLFNDVLDLFREADLVIGNLEFPLTDVGKGIVKCGPILRGTRSCLSVFEKSGFGLLGLANNHIRDCGDEGVFSTLDSCRLAGIRTVGAGEDASAARKPIVLKISGWNIGVIAFAEHEFNAATLNHAGANVFDPYESFDCIEGLRADCDYLIVLYHGGIEHYAYPSPVLQKKCRKLIDSGADLVLCQHSHCVGTTEKYGSGVILYGQGNTVFGYRPNSTEWNHGLLVKVSLSEGDNQRHSKVVDFIPIAATASGVNVMQPESAKDFMDDFFSRSQKVADNDFLHKSWLDFCLSKQGLYMPQFFGLGRILNYFNRKLKNSLIKVLFSKSRVMITMNLMRCDSHHEVMETILHYYVNGKVTDEMPPSR